MTTSAATREHAFVHPKHFVACLESLAESRPDDTALVAVGERDGEVVETAWTYRAFVQRVRALAAVLQRRFAKGERVLILLDNDEHYAISMFACFHAGVIAVPVFPPESMRPQHLARLAGIALDAQASGVLTARAFEAQANAAAGRFGVTAVIAVDTIDPDALDLDTANGWTPHEPAPGDVAFLQYTSGSTSAPKGVMVTHGNLMANERAIREGLSIGAGDKFGVWSPLFHDMGLIGGLLQPFYSGIPCVLSSPRFFLERPVRWLEMIARHRVTISGGPDFAYRLCLDRIKETQVAGLDLSSWRVAYTGAEPVRHDTMEAFIARYAPAGFAAGAVYPCYGLAEATLFVTGGQRGSGMAVERFDGEALARRRVDARSDGVALVGCGAAPSEHAIRIADPQTGAAIAEGAIGEIWAAGPSIAAGYWNKPRESAETFVERDGRRWLRTGDLGFVHAGRLFVAGRIKDMIIVRGHNLFPQDLERAVEAEVEAVRKGRSAAFAVEGAWGEGIGMAVEVSRSMQKLVRPEALVEVLSTVVSETCGEPLSVVVLLNPGGMPKTTSGKLQRSACRQGWRDRSADAYAIYEQGRWVLGGEGAKDEAAQGGQPAQSSDTEQALTALWRDVLRLDADTPLGRDAHFFASGGNSLSATYLAARIGRHWNVDAGARLPFAHPRLGEMAGAIDGLRSQGRPAQAGIAPLADEVRRGPLPCSHEQERQWFLWKMDPQGTAYHVAGALRLEGEVQAQALHAACLDLVARHESLRTLFRAGDDGMPRQHIGTEARLEWTFADLSVLDPAGREVRAQQEIRRLNVRPFDLEQGPLVRIALIRLDAQSHLLAVVMHHIVSDGASMQVFVDELAACWRARSQGTAAALAPLPIQYADYAAWQRGWLDAGVRESQLAWWRSQLGDEHPVLALPADHPRQAQAGHRAARHEIDLPPALTQALRRVARTQETSLFTVLLAAFQALLYRHTGQEDVRVGVPVANRARLETQGVIGLFVNTLVMRNVMHGRQTLAQVLAQAREMALGAQSHQDLPFDQLVEALQPQRSLGHSPLFQVMFNHLVQDHGRLAGAAGVHVEECVLAEETAQFELTLDVRELADGSLRPALRYAAGLFEPATMARFADHYVRMLEAVAASPDTPLDEVELLTPEEAAHLLAAGSAQAQEPLPEQGIHVLFEAQAAQAPARIALVDGERQFSYRELNERANRLAHRLRRLGAGSETKVGLALDRSAELIVAILAVLKVGAAYVPLDPFYPPERLRYMLRDSGARLLLTGHETPAWLDGEADVATLVLDTLDLSQEPSGNPNAAVHAGHLAYVIYTSGSTGQPKGAQLCHGNVVRLLERTRSWFGFDGSDVWTMFHSHAFDFSVWEIFGALCHGGQLVVVPYATSRDPAAFAGLLRQHRVTVLNQTPSAFSQLASHLTSMQRTDEALPLRVVIFGGEALEPASLKPWIERFGDACPRLVNMYGITETTVHVTYRPIVAADLEEGQRSPIGQQIPDLSLRVLDAGLKPVPAGVAGELYVAGAGLARGYLNRPGLTAERFVADPFDVCGGRLYRTGDLVRRRADGEIEYLGRRDQQVKIRGFRIEVGEIEARMLALPGVREAVVQVRQGPAGPCLAAYVSPSGGTELQAQVLRQALGRHLPDYMVPTHVTVLPALPLTVNGKVDRKALPEPVSASASIPADALPAGEIEQAVAAVWSALLGTERVGRHDNFFEIGGHSLLLMKVQHRLEESLGRSISVVDLFRYPTVASLAAFVGGPGTGAGSDVSRQAAERAGRQRGAFLARKPAVERTPL